LSQELVWVITFLMSGVSFHLFPGRRDAWGMISRLGPDAFFNSLVLLAVKWLPLPEFIFSTSPNQEMRLSKSALTTPFAVALDRGSALTQLVRWSTITSKYFKHPI
jgi:hypothetical protein